MKFEMDFTYVNEETGKSETCRYELDGDNYEDGIVNAYECAKATEGADQIVDMTVTCKEMNKSINLDEVLEIVNKKSKQGD